MKVAITGSTGFLAQGLIPRLEGRGDEVVRVVRPSTDAAGITWDPDRGTIDAAGFEGIDAVVNLAGAGVGDKRWTDERKAVLTRSRVDATALLVRALTACERKPRVVISASAVGYYGDRGAHVLDEDSGPGSGFLADLCRRWEDAAGAARAAGIRVVTIRTGVVLGRGGALFRRLVPIFRLGLGGRLGDGTHYQSWIARDDHGAAMMWLLDSDLDGAVNLTAPEPVTNAEFTRALGRALRRPAILPVPRVAIAALMGRELASELLASQRVVPAQLDMAGFVFAHRTIDDALMSIFA